MTKHIITIRPRFWWPTIGFIGLASALLIMLIVQAVTEPGVKLGIGLLFLVGILIWLGRGLNQRLSISATNLIIKHSGHTVTIDWEQIAGVGTLQSIAGLALPYLILRQPYANLPEPQLRRLASEDLRDTIVIINPLRWANIAKLWPLLLQQLPATNNYQVPFDFSGVSRVQRRIFVLFGLLSLVVAGLIWLFS